MDQDKRVKTLRRELEGWREVLVGLHSILIWEQQYYPAISSSVVTFIFFLIWYIDPSILTLLSIIGLLITISDYFIPQVVPWFYGSNHWTGANERRYEQIVSSIAGCTGCFSKCNSKMQTMKASSPKSYFVGTTTFLLFCAWIGSSINNFFLTYLVVLFLVLLPGLRKKDIIRKNFAAVIEMGAGLLKGFVKKKSSTDVKEEVAESEKKK